MKHTDKVGGQLIINEEVIIQRTKEYGKKTKTNKMGGYLNKLKV